VEAGEARVARPPLVSYLADVLSLRVTALRLHRVAPPALDQRVVEHGFVIVFARDHRHLVPDAGIDDPLAVKLSSKAFRVDPGKGVAGAIHAPTAVAPTNDCDEVACLLVVVSCDELGERPLRGSTAQEGDDVLSVAPHLFLRIVSPSPI
jgi:hypothetical protein